MTAVLAPVPGLAKNCKSDSGLLYLGNTKDESKSVWLSATVAGSFELEAAQGNTTVDSWEKEKRGLHVSTSPFVSTGNGGVHRVFNMEDPGGPCLIDTQNQKGGIKIPPNISFPSVMLPGRPLPPIGSFFPDFGGGLMPTLPTVPPGGVMPTLPTVPPSGVMPTLPTVPPSGVMPTVPPGGVKPTLSGGVRPPEVPLTEGRDLGEPTLWNIWAEGRLVSVSDERYDLDMDTDVDTATFGVDRRLNEDVVLGVCFSWEDSETDGFGDFLKADTSGFNVGPYIAVRLSPNWAFDVSLAYGRYDNHVELAILSGDYTSQRYSGTVTLHGQYMVDEFLVRPKASVTYSHVESDGYDLEGQILGLPIEVGIPDNSFDYGAIEASAEFSRFFSLPDGKYVMPFLELGGRYEFERPNGGEILAGDLSLVTPSPWPGTARTRFRMLLAETVQLEATAGYLSIGQSGLDVWEGKRHLSYGF